MCPVISEMLTFCESCSRNEKNQLFLGIRRASRPQTVMPSSVLSSDSMHFGLLAAAAHAASTNSRFNIFYNPRYLSLHTFKFVSCEFLLKSYLPLILRASPSEFVIPLAKYVKAVYHTRVSVGMRFRMLFETEESSVRRYVSNPIMGVMIVFLFFLQYEFFFRLTNYLLLHFHARNKNCS